MSDWHELMDRPAWIDDANCRGLDPELFFPSRGDSTAEAKSVCRACDVQAECLAYALNNGEKHGTWGGMSERERRRLRRQRPVKLTSIDHGTVAGAAAHRRRGERPCAFCLEATAAYKAERKDRLRAESQSKRPDEPSFREWFKAARAEALARQSQGTQ